MTDKEKAKAYDEALERAKKYNIDEAYASQGTVIKSIFPQLRKSEDERTKRELIGYLTHRAEVTPFISEEKDCKRWIAYLESQKEQNKAEWSKEDAARLKEEIDAFNESVKDWLNSLYSQTKQKRSDDEGLIDLAVAAIEDFYGESNPIRSQIINLLKSLRHSWKPTWEQMDALKRAVHKLADTEVADSVRLSFLYDHLKELM